MTTPTAPSGGTTADLRIDAVDLVGRPGAHRHVTRTVTAPAPDETGPAMQVPEGTPITIDVELESVVEGIYVHGTASAHVTGECSRCLDPVEDDLEVRIDELFLYPQKVKPEEREDSVLLEDDIIDLTPLVHDALTLEADERPLCRPDCPGLCGQCGFRMEQDPSHEHVVIDDRWAALQGLLNDTNEQTSTDQPTDGESR